MKSKKKRRIRMVLTLRVLHYARRCVKLGWTQGQTAKVNKAGMPVAWCALGAIQQGGRELSKETLGAIHKSHRAKRRAMRQFKKANRIDLSGGLQREIWKWNDKTSRTQAEVIEAFSRAIDRVEAKR